MPQGPEVDPPNWPTPSPRDPYVVQPTPDMLMKRTMRALPICTHASRSCQCRQSRQRLACVPGLWDKWSHPAPLSSKLNRSALSHPVTGRGRYTAELPKTRNVVSVRGRFQDTLVPRPLLPTQRAARRPSTRSPTRPTPDAASTLRVEFGPLRRPAQPAAAPR